MELERVEGSVWTEPRGIFWDICNHRGKWSLTKVGMSKTLISIMTGVHHDKNGIFIDPKLAPQSGKTAVMEFSNQGVLGKPRLCREAPNSM